MLKHEREHYNRYGEAVVLGSRELRVVWADPDDHSAGFFCAARSGTCRVREGRSAHPSAIQAGFDSEDGCADGAHSRELLDALEAGEPVTVRGCRRTFCPRSGAAKTGTAADSKSPPMTA